MPQQEQLLALLRVPLVPRIAQNVQAHYRRQLMQPLAVVLDGLPIRFEQFPQKHSPVVRPDGLVAAPDEKRVFEPGKL